MRQALLYATVDQKDYLASMIGDAEERPALLFVLHLRHAAVERGRRGAWAKGQEANFDKAKELIKEAGYKGEKIVIIDATDQPIVHSQSLLTAENAAQARPERRPAGGRLGHADHAAPDRRSRSTRRRLVDLPHRGWSASR